MASVRATKQRDIRRPEADFEIPLADAIAALIDPGEIAPGDTWHFQIRGETLQISRLRAVEPALVARAARTEP